MELNELDVIFLDKNGKEVGRLFVKKGKLSFVGKIDKSAKVFFDYLKEYMNR